MKGFLDRAGIMYSLLKPVRMLRLNLRPENCLKNLKAKILADVVNRSGDELLRSHNFGRKSLRELREVLSQDNLKFGVPFDFSLYFDIISLALPKAIIRDLSGYQDTQVSGKRQVLLVLADIIFMEAIGKDIFE